jgi:hypothetical protein
MNLDYYTLLSPEPIRLSVGSIKSPTLREIGDITFRQFGIYQVYLKLTPKDYYNEINKEKLPYWESLTDEQRSEMTMWEVVMLEPDVVPGYLRMFNFFFLERVIFREGVFLVIDTDDYKTPDDELEINKDNLRGILHHDLFTDVLDVIQQVCCMKSKKPVNIKDIKFKNDKARRMYERMLKAKEEKDRIEAKKNAKDFAIPNVISSVAAKSNNLNIINIWDATLFQLFDQFNKLRSGDVHYVNEVRVSVWGDEKKQFDPALWYRNQFDDNENDGLF